MFNKCELYYYRFTSGKLIIYLTRPVPEPKNVVGYICTPTKRKTARKQKRSEMIACGVRHVQQ